MRLRKLFPTLLAALAATALAAAPAPAGAATPKLRIAAVEVATRKGPLVLRVEADPRAEVHLQVNGQPVHEQFTRIGGDLQQIELRSANELRPGANRLRLESRAGGVVRRASRTVKVPGWSLRADAGADDSVSVSADARLGVAAAPTAGRGDVDYSWRVTRRPPGARVKLRGHGSSRPLVEASKPGAYVLEMEADPTAGPEPTSYDSVTVSVVPNDPPIGVPINTIAPGGAIQIAGTSYGAGDTGSAYVVLERTTRAVKASGRVNSDGEGLAKLNKLADEYGGTRYMMIVSGQNGVPRELIDGFAKLLRKLGVALPSQENFAGLALGLPYSVIGIPGAPAGSATVRIPGGGYTPGISGAISGYLQTNQAVKREGAPVYEYVAGEFPLFDTKAPGSEGTVNKMVINGQTYANQLPPGTSAGFHLVVLESMTLRPLYNGALSTNGGDTSAAVQQGAAINEFINQTEKPGGALIFVQSIGKPKAAGPDWSRLAERIARFGGNPLLVYALDGTSEYSFVGRFGAKSPPAEASTAYDKGPYAAPKYPPARLLGTLIRSRTSNFVPSLASEPVGDSLGAVNTSMIETAYQAPKPWPPLGKDIGSADEVAKVQAYLCSKTELCGEGAKCSELRECFWKRYNADWGAVRSNLEGRAPYPAGATYSERTFAAVKEELLEETIAVQKVHKYLADVLAPFEQGATGTWVDLQAITEQIFNSAQIEKESEATSWALGLLSKVAALGTLSDKYESAASGISAAFDVASSLSTPAGPPILASEVAARGKQLGKELFNRVELARQASDGLGMILVSDYGKLTAARAAIASEKWPEVNRTAAISELQTAARQWSYEALMPVGYPYLIRANGVSNARSLNCVDVRQNWPSQPDQFQMNAITGYDASGNPISSDFFIARGNGRNASPAASVAEAMFRPREGDEPGLGMEKLQFFTPRIFGGRIQRAINGTPSCTLGWLPNLR